MWLATCHTDLVTQPTNPDRHRKPGVLTRVDADRRDAAREVLEARGWTMSDFLAACIELVIANPDAMLNRLKQFRPEVRIGRPPATPSDPPR